AFGAKRSFIFRTASASLRNAQASARAKREWNLSAAPSSVRPNGPRGRNCDRQKPSLPCPSPCPSPAKKPLFIGHFESAADHRHPLLRARMRAETLPAAPRGFFNRPEEPRGGLYVVELPLMDATTRAPPMRLRMQRN